MAPSTVHLPNGQTLTVNPSFGGLYFKANDLNPHHAVFPPGWTIILHSEDDYDDDFVSPSSAAHTIPVPTRPADSNSGSKPTPAVRLQEPADIARRKRQNVHRFVKPTLRNDHLFISSISNPSSNDFRPPSSPTRQIAMMLWATLWWYFHQPAPDPQMLTPSSVSTPDAGKPKGEWRIYINREGIFKSRHLLPKLERMGLITTEDSSVGADPEDGSIAGNYGEGWKKCFVSRRSFWQLDPRIYLFTIAPTHHSSPYPSMSPAGSRPPSRPGSPTRPPSSGIQMTSKSAYDNNRNGADHAHPNLTPGHDIAATSGAASTAASQSHATMGLWRGPATPPGPFTSGSHLPTFYPPHPLQYTFTNSIRHPIRPKPPRPGETFYMRYVPSLNQYISFRVASLSSHPIAYRGPVGTATRNASPDPIVLSIKKLTVEKDTTELTDVDLLHKWMNDDRVAYSWGEQGPKQHQADFLHTNLQSRHSFPAIGLFDGKPFGYFELYWAKEDRLSMHLGGAVGDWDRGIHCLVGEQEFRGPHRVRVWLSALIHYCWLADMRTEAVMMEPRVDNEKLRKYCEEVGFYKQQEISFPHKQSNLMKIRREAWEAPAL
ncbi:hypothetical protein K431DRAFT_321085 [Polychaeton citri CBS 116435]|uniref:Acyltransferase MbtK/IucB-like conserved domain-containing protein n=1 Tax=Polychaeton citri CBS 116435 TaxID=1314669 RepID=A0A9P4Q8X4_9PEZI|nr:hypothetical protein K431DRAFT_321085 [Polychaeton citri CBS 116435]